MKNLIYTVTIAISLMIVSCTSNSSSSEENQSTMKEKDSMPMNDSASLNKDVKSITATFTVVDPGVPVFMKSLLQNYLSLKNALINDNTGEAATSSGKMYNALKKFDKSLLTADQKNVFDDLEDDLKEHAEHISGKNDIEHKRSHFSMMSEDMYDMVKAFGASIILYHDYCPMAKDNQGAMWLSEIKDIRNPYFGQKMMGCGSVEGMFQ